jgi:hypothetical protein
MYCFRVTAAKDKQVRCILQYRAGFSGLTTEKTVSFHFDTIAHSHVVLAIRSTPCQIQPYSQRNSFKIPTKPTLTGDGFTSWKIHYFVDMLFLSARGFDWSSLRVIINFRLTSHHLITAALLISSILHASVDTIATLFHGHCSSASFLHAAHWRAIARTVSWYCQLYERRISRYRASDMNYRRGFQITLDFASQTKSWSYSVGIGYDSVRLNFCQFTPKFNFWFFQPKIENIVFLNNIRY